MNRTTTKIRTLVATVAVLSIGLQGCDWFGDIGDWNDWENPGVSTTPGHSDTGSCTAPVPECEVGATQLCAMDGAQGDCALGVQSCGNEGWSACEPRFVAESERCGARGDDAYGPASGDEDCDGRVDETDPESDPEGCTVYMRDRDGDGWGAIGPSYREDPQNATHGCFCGEPPKELKLKLANGKHNKDCGDCGFYGVEVYPGADKYHDEPSTCLANLNWSGGAFDYNCDGEKEYLFNQRGNFGTCAYDESGSCRRTGDGPWLGEFPDCGEIGEVPECSRGPFGRSCNIRGFVAGRTQYCR